MSDFEFIFPQQYIIHTKQYTYISVLLLSDDKTGDQTSQLYAFCIIQFDQHLVYMTEYIQREFNLRTNDSGFINSNSQGTESF